MIQFSSLRRGSHPRLLWQDKYSLEGEPALLGGRQALVRLPIVQRELDRRAGLNTAGFISGYRGSPLGGYDMELWKAAATLKANDIVFEPGLNEDLAMTALAGIQQLGFIPGANSTVCSGSGTARVPASIVRVTRSNMPICRAPPPREESC